MSALQSKKSNFVLPGKQSIQRWLNLRVLVGFPPEKYHGRNEKYFLYLQLQKTKKKQVHVLETRAATPNAPPVILQSVNEPYAPFTPPIQVINECFEVSLKAQDPLSLFLAFFGGV
jgi:hypothetical protein